MGQVLTVDNCCQFYYKLTSFASREFFFPSRADTFSESFQTQIEMTETQSIKR